MVPALYRNTTFSFGNLEKDTYIAVNELDDLMILSLFAAFERWLRDVLIEKSEILESVLPAELGLRLLKLAQEEMDRWKVKEIIRLFDFVSQDHTMKLTQILAYRNWVAHGKNPTKLPPLKTDAKTVYETIIYFMEDIERIVI